MALDPSYLAYAKRRYGMDHDRYAWSMLVDRNPVTWPGNAPVALWISVHLEFFPLNPEGKPFKLPGGMVTPYPDLRHFTLRDYGNRVGVQRLLRLFERLGLRASFPTNAAVATRIPSLVREIASAGHELVGHGRDMDQPHYGGMDESVERSLIADSLTTLRKVSGQRVDGWISPGKSESWTTPDLLAEQGVRWFGDWINDDMPYRFATTNGKLVALPHSSELDDRQILIEYRHAESAFTEQLLDQHAFLAREAVTGGGRVLAITLHPWVIGQPHRIGALERALEAIVSAGVWNTVGGDLWSTWEGQQAA